MTKYISIGFALGLVTGVLVYHIGGRAELVRLRADNAALIEELAILTPRPVAPASLDPRNLPYDESADARAELGAARTRAAAANKLLMVTFGANWCEDCRALHRQLQDPEVARYVAGSFELLNVNVGKFNRNVTLAYELGVSLDRGIPVAVFFDRRGELIGTTNAGELEPARFYTSKQILKFVRDVAERRRIARPDAP